MKAVRIVKPYAIEIADIDMPIPKPGEALLKLLYAGICGSDLGSYRGTFPYFEYPRIPGHEFSAKIIELNGKSPFNIGDTVSAYPYFNCNNCYPCRKKNINCCAFNETLGCQRDGVFAEYVTMPIDRLIDSKGLSAKELALIEPFSISRHGIDRADIKAGDKVLIIGAGTIGTLAAISALSRGASVYVTDISPVKLELASRLLINGRFINDDNFIKNVAEITDGDGFDCVIEAVGEPAAFQNCIDAAAFSGSVVLIGIGKKNLDFNYTEIQRKELNIYGSRNALFKDFSENISLIKSGGADLNGIVTNTYPWLCADRAFEDLDKNGANILKALLVF